MTDILQLVRDVNEAVKIIYETDEDCEYALMILSDAARHLKRGLLEEMTQYFHDPEPVYELPV
jgi:hypothetical protein